MSNEIQNIRNSQEITVEQAPPKQKAKSASRKYEAIRTCKKEHNKEFQRKKVITLAFAIGGIAMVIIPAIAIAITAFSPLSFPIAILIITPIALLAASILVKQIEKRTQYWSGDLAIKLLEQKAKKAQKTKNKLA